MDLQMSGKVAMVAASSRGLGRACAIGLAREGVKVSLAARSAEALAKVADEIREETGSDDVLTVPTDVTQADQIQRWADQTMERFGGVDILVTNAGGPPHGVWDDFLTDEAWIQAFELNMLSTIRMIRAVVPSMRARGGGRILNIQSTLREGADRQPDPVEHDPPGRGRPGQEPLAGARRRQHPGQHGLPWRDLHGSAALGDAGSGAAGRHQRGRGALRSGPPGSR